MGVIRAYAKMRVPIKYRELEPDLLIWRPTLKASMLLWMMSEMNRVRIPMEFS
jgi:hypothetical protein